MQLRIQAAEMKRDYDQDFPQYLETSCGSHLANKKKNSAIIVFSKPCNSFLFEKYLKYVLYQNLHIIFL